ncbi:MAG: hypothetical protein ACI8PW_000808 [Methylophilaceae bacterium]|jgi:hypothetical protein
MGIDPASPKCDTFYQKAADLSIPIIAHTGSESPAHGSDQNHGYPRLDVVWIKVCASYWQIALATVMMKIWIMAINELAT